MDQNELLAAINDQELVDLAADLIRFASPVGEEQALGRHLASYLAAMGLVVSVREVDRGRSNILAVLPGGEQDHVGLLFHGHMDTIPFLHMADPLSGEIIEGHIWGRGSVDQKGGLAAAIAAIQALSESRVPLRKGVALAAVVDEESEHRGSYALAEDGIKADLAIVTEPSDLQLMIGHKGTVPARITVHGRQAHGSTPWLGTNAIEHAARVVDALARLESKSLEVPGIGRIQGSVNIGLIQGGTAYNNVPDRCDIYLDRRTVPGEDQASVLTEIQAILDDLAAADPKFSARVQIDRPDWTWPAIKARGLNPAVTLGETPLTRVLAAAHEQVTGQALEVGYYNGYLDMDFLVNDLSIPTVNYGPGADELSHTDEERLDVSQLLAAARVYALAAWKLCGVPLAGT
jgi:acetylornithine deacetylase/succinyl-diaminopimelate desuccinylase family protein